MEEAATAAATAATTENGSEAEAKSAAVMVEEEELGNDDQKEKNGDNNNDDGITNINNRRSSLHSAFPRHVGYISTLFSLGNIALQIYSHISTSATFLSSVPLDDKGASSPIAPGTSVNNPTTSTASCLEDRGNFDTWWEQRGRNEFFGIAETCGPQYLFDSTGGSYLDCIRTQFGFDGTEACLDCFKLPVQCVMESCLSTCLLEGLQSQGCVDCLVEFNCDGPVEECTGVSIGLADWAPALSVETSNTTSTDISNNSTNTTSTDISNNSTNQGRRRRLQADAVVGTTTATTAKTSTQLYEVYSISFVDSIADAANGGAWYLVIILVCLSGIWPYLKNVIMLIAWFVPMTASFRSSLLQWLTRLAKWSLVDVFVIIIICTGVKIDQQITNDMRFVLLAEPRVGIITFCLAALWDLSQGEWMRTKHFEMMHQQDHQEATGGPIEEAKQEANKNESLSPVTSSDSGDNDRTSPLCQQVRYRNDTRSCSSFGMILYGVIVAMQIALIGAVIGTLCITFSVSGFPSLGSSTDGPTQYEYTAVTVATSLLHNFGTISPGGTTAFVGTVFMVIVYLGMCIILPLLCSVLMATSFLLPGGIINKNAGRLRRYFSMVDILGGFSCLDVWLLAFVLCALEFNHLMESAIYEIAGNFCTDMGLCITLSSTIEKGVYISIPAVILGWIVEACFTYTEAYFVHPSEMFAPWQWFFGLHFWTKKVHSTSAENDDKFAKEDEA